MVATILFSLMILISCVGAGKCEDLYIKCADHCAKALGLPINRSFGIDIDICKNDKNDGLEAYLDIDEEADYTIMINQDLCMGQIMMAIAHEMIHIHQYERGDLNYDEISNEWWWKDKIVHVKRYKHYENIPWEKEAYGGERQLFDSFMGQ